MPYTVKIYKVLWKYYIDDAITHHYICLLQMAQYGLTPRSATYRIGARIVSTKRTFWIFIIVLLYRRNMAQDGFNIASKCIQDGLIIVQDGFKMAPIEPTHTFILYYVYTSSMYRTIHIYNKL